MKNIFLTDDDSDDCLLFSEVVDEIFSQDAKLTIINDGVKLMKVLDETVPPAPEVIFLDLNMPLKNGFECIDEIRGNPKFKNIPIVVFSTSANNDIVDKTYAHGANYYVCKPRTYRLLKKTIEFVLSLDNTKLKEQPLRDQFVINMS